MMMAMRWCECVEKCRGLGYYDRTVSDSVCLLVESRRTVRKLICTHSWTGVDESGDFSSYNVRSLALSLGWHLGGAQSCSGHDDDDRNFEHPRKYVRIISFTSRSRISCYFSLIFVCSVILSAVSYDRKSAEGIDRGSAMLTYANQHRKITRNWLRYQSNAKQAKCCV